MGLAVRNRIVPFVARLRRVAHVARRRASFDLSSACSELWSGRVVPRRLLALNLVMAGVSVFCCLRIGHALFAPAPQPPSSTARALAVPGDHDQNIVRTSRSSGYYETIASRSLFNPDRAESAPAESAGRAPLTIPTLALYGVAISDDTRVAFVQDLATKRISSYKTGDPLAGGRVERIEPDQIVINRADGPIEIRLHRPKDSPTLAPSPQGQSPEEVVPPRRARGRQD
jgi:type II secretion system (T2SS) protein C